MTTVTAYRQGDRHREGGLWAVGMNVPLSGLFALLLHFILCVWVSCLHVWPDPPWRSQIPGGFSDPLELVLQMVVSRHGCWEWPSGRTASVLLAVNLSFQPLKRQL